MIIGHCTYDLKEGCRDAFIKELKDCGYYEKASNDRGCHYYTPYYSIDNPNQLIVTECWETEDDLRHHEQADYIRDLDAASAKYLLSLTLEFYDGDMTYKKDVLPIEVLLGGNK